VVVDVLILMLILISVAVAAVVMFVLLVADFIVFLVDDFGPPAGILFTKR
jgi:hypothetical protein